MIQNSLVQHSACGHGQVSGPHALPTWSGAQPGHRQHSRRCQPYHHPGLQIPSHAGWSRSRLATNHHRSADLMRCHASNDPEAKDAVLDNERVIATLTSVGISGTAAVLGAQLAGINLWAQFDWSGPSTSTALKLGAFLIAYEFLLLGVPWYTGLKDAQPPPSSGPTEGADFSSNFKRSPFNLQIGAALLTPEQGNQMSADLLRATLALQQACFVATAAMRAELPPAVDVALIVVRESSKELLQRGLLVTFLSAWLADRCFEAGAADDVLVLGTWTVYTTEACRWAMASLATLFLLPPVLADAQAMSLSVASNWAVMSTQTGDESNLDKDMQEFRLYDALQRTVGALPARITYGLHASRGILRFASVNAVFAVTQSLSASLTLAVVSNLLLFLYSVKGRGDLGLKTPNDVKGVKGSQKRPPSLKWPPQDGKEKGSGKDD